MVVTRWVSCSETQVTTRPKAVAGLPHLSHRLVAGLSQGVPHRVVSMCREIVMKLSRNGRGIVNVVLGVAWVCRTGGCQHVAQARGCIIRGCHADFSCWVAKEVFLRLSRRLRSCRGPGSLAVVPRDIRARGVGGDVGAGFRGCCCKGCHGLPRTQTPNAFCCDSPPRPVTSVPGLCAQTGGGRVHLSIRESAQMVRREPVVHRAHTQHRPTACQGP